MGFLQRDKNLCGIFRQLVKLCKESEKDLSTNLQKRDMQHKFLSLEVDDFLSQIVETELQVKRLDFKSYRLPTLFFLFIYFSGIIMLLPLANSIFDHTSTVNTYFIPLTQNENIPLIIMQWGFIGGLTYTTINMVARFLRQDLAPRVYLLAALRLLLSSAVSVVIYLSTEYFLGISPSSDIPPQLLLAVFLACAFPPIQFLINFADSHAPRISQLWKRTNLPGNRPLTRLEGLNLVDAERLGEEGINSIHQMAL